MTAAETFEALRMPKKTCGNCEHGVQLYYGGYECIHNYQQAESYDQICGMLTAESTPMKWKWNGVK